AFMPAHSSLPTLRRGLGSGRRTPSCPESIEPLLELLESHSQLPVLPGQSITFGRYGQRRVEFPPVEPDLLRLVDRTDEKANLNGQPLDIRQIDPDITGDDKPLIQDAVQEIDQAVGARG